MKIEQLPSGSFRIRKMYKGQMYTIVTDFKPTQKEALALMSRKMDEIQGPLGSERMMFSRAAQEYCDSKVNIVSPSTIRDYRRMPGRFSESFSRKNIYDITQKDLQDEINIYAADHSYGTVRNMSSFARSVIAMYRPDFNPKITLPLHYKNEKYIPTGDDIRIILQEATGTVFEIPVMLGCFGMRRSEICALTADDINGTTVTINKAMVQDDHNSWIIKKTKTVESTRTITITEELANRIIEQGYAYSGHPGQITKFMRRIQKKHGIPEFSLHKLRHYFASRLSEMHVPDADILKMGGWSTDHVMKTVYRHSLDKENRMQQEVASKLSEELFS